MGISKRLKRRGERGKERVSGEKRGVLIDWGKGRRESEGGMGIGRWVGGEGIIERGRKRERERERERD